MWIISWNLFLMKKLLKSKVCRSCKQCMGPICIAEMCIVYWRKVNNCGLKKKKKKKKEENAKRESKPHLSLGFLNIEPWYPVDKS